MAAALYRGPTPRQLVSLISAACPLLILPFHSLRSIRQLFTKLLLIPLINSMRLLVFSFIKDRSTKEAKMKELIEALEWRGSAERGLRPITHLFESLKSRTHSKQSATAANQKIH